MITGAVIAGTLAIALTSVAVVAWAWRREEARARAQRSERIAEVEQARKELGL